MLNNENISYDNTVLTLHVPLSHLRKGKVTFFCKVIIYDQNELHKHSRFTLAFFFLIK